MDQSTGSERSPRADCYFVPLNERLRSSRCSTVFRKSIRATRNHCYDRRRGNLDDTVRTPGHPGSICHFVSNYDVLCCGR